MEVVSSVPGSCPQTSVPIVGAPTFTKNLVKGYQFRMSHSGRILTYGNLWTPVQCCLLECSIVWRARTTVCFYISRAHSLCRLGVLPYTSTGRTYSWTSDTRAGELVIEHDAALADSARWSNLLVERTQI